MTYNNREGKVTKMKEDAIFIDGEKFLTNTPKSASIIPTSQAGVGDTVVFNFHCKTKEIIFLRMKHPYYKGTEARPHSHSNRYIEDPRDPDEVHDMEIVYGREFEGM